MTTYPQLLTRFAKENGINVEFCLLKGSVEVAPRVGLADGICDLVSTGATLEANGLKEVAEVFRSKASLIQRADDLGPEKTSDIRYLVTKNSRRDESKRKQVHHATCTSWKSS